MSQLAITLTVTMLLVCSSVDSLEQSSSCKTPCSRDSSSSVCGTPVKPNTSKALKSFPNQCAFNLYNCNNPENRKKVHEKLSISNKTIFFHFIEIKVIWKYSCGAVR